MGLKQIFLNVIAVTLLMHLPQVFLMALIWMHTVLGWNRYFQMVRKVMHTESHGDPHRAGVHHAGAAASRRCSTKPKRSRSAG